MVPLLPGQPHLSKAFKLFTDLFCIEKVRNVAGLYLNLVDHATVLSADEKSKIQTLDRRQPQLPMDRSYVEGYTHNYRRHGATTLFVVPDIATDNDLQVRGAGTRSPWRLSG